MYMKVAVALATFVIGVHADNGCYCKDGESKFSTAMSISETKCKSSGYASLCCNNGKGNCTWWECTATGTLTTSCAQLPASIKESVTALENVNFSSWTKGANEITVSAFYGGSCSSFRANAERGSKFPATLPAFRYSYSGSDQIVAAGTKVTDVNQCIKQDWHGQCTLTEDGFAFKVTCSSLGAFIGNLNDALDTGMSTGIIILIVILSGCCFTILCFILICCCFCGKAAQEMGNMQDENA